MAKLAMASKLFSLAYILHVPLGEAAVPVVYAFMESKTQESFGEFLDSVIAASEAVSALPALDLIITDFETSLRMRFLERTSSVGAIFIFA